MNDVRTAVRERYGSIAAGETSGCCDPGCCDPSARLGYGADDLEALPEGANLGLGCGNPVAIASLAPGETVLDLGSGGGIDCFLAAERVGSEGRVIGVDMTPEMLTKARANAASGGFANVDFRLGEIEHLPVADASVDVILSNCVINLSPDKPAVFREALRVLKPGGRLAISDPVASAPIPDAVREDIEMHVGCLAGAVTPDAYRAMLEGAGFVDVEITTNEQSRTFIKDWAPGTGLEQYVVSATIEARRP
jgi:SAM-dependent methyltransferase